MYVVAGVKPQSSGTDLGHKSWSLVWFDSSCIIYIANLVCNLQLVSFVCGHDGDVVGVLACEQESHENANGTPLGPLPTELTTTIFRYDKIVICQFLSWKATA